MDPELARAAAIGAACLLGVFGIGIGDMRAAQKRAAQADAPVVTPYVAKAALPPPSPPVKAPPPPPGQPPQELGEPPWGAIPKMGGSPRGAPSRPRIRMGASVVKGPLPPEVIVRIVRQSLGRFRLCYERGLLDDRGLAGNVTVKFVVGRTGEVMTAADGGSTLPARPVIACIVRTFGAMSFPQPDNGIVTVVLPIDLSLD